jgi:CRISPR-associated protein Cas1
MASPDRQAWARFDFTKRNRRPPRDPVNALLSFVYAMLLKDLMATLVGVGLDPYLGFYHQPRYGRPALGLDLMEEFRPLVADSVVINLINNGEVRPTDFITRAGACALTPHGRKQVLEGYERRLDMLVTHPHFGYAISYRRIFEVQARLLARLLTGEINFYPAFCTR